jgi:hypothetical protein
MRIETDALLALYTKQNVSTCVIKGENDACLIAAAQLTEFKLEIGLCLD